VPTGRPYLRPYDLAQATRRRGGQGQWVVVQADLTVIAVAGGSASTSHSQSRRTSQPASVARASARLSRTLLRLSLSSHSAALGPVKVLLPWRLQPCQKQPSTNTARRYLGSTRSGVHPVARRRCSRKRRPRACNARRSSTSGRVFALRRPRRWLPASVDTQLPRCRLPATESMLRASSIMVGLGAG
jgi:hypothetical protein